MRDVKEYVWYGLSRNKIIVNTLHIHDVFHLSPEQSKSLGIKKIETNLFVDSGRLVFDNNDVLEYLGEL